MVPFFFATNKIIIVAPMKILIAFRQSAKRNKLKKNEITRVCLVFLCTQTDVLSQGLTLRPTFRLTLCDKDKINDLNFFFIFLFFT